MDTKSQKRTFSEKQAAKKAAVLGNDKKRKGSLATIVLSACALLIFFTAFFFLNKTEKPGPQQVLSSNAHQVTYPVELFQDGLARHFQHETESGVTIKYFIIRSGDGVIRAAFDACDVCWPAGLGYSQAGDSMVCRNCGRQFASVQVNEVQGGCNPAPLKREVVDNKLVIQVRDILAGKAYFDLPKRS